jgi:hypothetical protein
MMSIEGPFLAAVMARLAEPKANLAAYGVAFAVALIVEAPVIMMLSATTALAEDGIALRRLARFTYTLNLAVTAAMLLLIAPPVYRIWAAGWIGLPPDVARLTWLSLLVLLPWPGAIGYRRLYQGAMIRCGQTRRVAYGTLVRLASMALTALLAARFGLPGALVGAAALSAGVVLEAVAGRIMALDAVRRIRAERRSGRAPGYGEIARFYAPLAMTSVIGLAAQPVTTFFMGQSRNGLESLAVLPVVIALTFVFRSLGLAFQDVAISFLGRSDAHRGPVMRFAATLGAAASLGLAAIAFTPLAEVWFRTVSGLSAELTAFALTPTRILVLLPAMSVLLSLQRAVLVHGRATRPVGIATAAELAAIVGVLLVAIHLFDMVGATAAAVAFVLGRLASNGLLVPPCLAVLRSSTVRVRRTSRS